MRRLLLAVAFVLSLASQAWAVADFTYGGVNCGQTSKSWTVVLRKTSDNTEATGVTSAQITAYHDRPKASSVQITTASLANAAAGYTSGGFVEIDATNMPGAYRFDLPTATVACGADWVHLAIRRVYGTAVYVYHERLGLASAPDVNVLRWNGTAAIATTMSSNVFRWNGTLITATMTAANVQKWSSTLLTATQVGANVQKISGAAVSTSSAQIGANLVNVAGAAVSTSTAQLGVNAVNWNGTAIIATQVGANVQKWVGSTPNGLTNSRVPVAAQVQKNVALATFMFLLTDSVNHNPKTSAGAVGCTRSIDAGVFATGTMANVVEVGKGYYAVDYGAGDLNGKNILTVCQGNGTDASGFTLVTYP